MRTTNTNVSLVDPSSGLKELTPNLQGTWTRSQVAKKLNVSPTTIMRWERKGVVQPYFVPHSRTYHYTDEMVEAMRKHRDSFYQVQVQPQEKDQLPSKDKTAASLSKVAKAIKVNRSIDKMIARRFGMRRG
jgi:transcriptional regulator with XRE-family HTH domain